MADKMVKRAQVLPSDDGRPKLSKHDEAMEKLAGRQNLELLKMGGAILQLAGKVLQSRERQQELVEKRKLLQFEIEKLEKEHAKSRDEFDAHRDRLHVARQLLPSAIREELPALLALVGEVSASERTELVKRFLEKIPTVDVKV